MFVRISDLQIRDFAFHLEIKPGALALPGDPFAQEEPVRADGVVHYRVATREILVRGSLSTIVSYPCDRCLEAIRRPLQLAFNLAYLPEDASPTEDEREVGAGEIDLAFYQDDGLNLADVLREQILLDLPMRRVCEPACGRNPLPAQGEVAESRDPRWNALAGYRPKPDPTQD
ncbi:MAG: DUF177 domain-containing protein [Bryobacterales bacterium]|jgi:uncharacterized protein|nr:DUF177 domain-containing protein [Bryobacterales bacterium]